MNPAKVVEHEVEGQRVRVVLDLLGEGVRQPGEPAHAHPDVQVLPLGIAGRNLARIRLAGDHPDARPGAHRRAVAGFRPRLFTVNLDQLRVIDLRAERILHRLNIGLVRVGRQLNAMAQAAGQIVHELVRRASVPPSDMPAGNQLRFGIDRRPRPHVAVTELPALLLRDVLRLGVAEGPDFVALQPAAFEVAEHPVLELGARLASFDLELNDGVDRHPAEAGGRPDADAFNEAGEDAGAGFGGELVHAHKYAFLR